MSIQRIVREDGALRIDWSQYDRKNFAKYRLYLGCCPFVESSDVARTHFYDTTFVGGTRSYRVEAYNQQDIYSTSPAKDFTDDGLVLRGSKHTGKNFQVSWSKSKYHKAFQFYLISMPEIEYNNAGVIKTKSDVNDTMENT